MKSKILNYGRDLFYRYPYLQPLLMWGKSIFFPKAKFYGWGMSTQAVLPQIDDDGKVFRETSYSIKKFHFNRRLYGIDKDSVDSLLWRHWIVITAVRYSIKISNQNHHNFVECGVGEGLTAYFSLEEIKKFNKIENFSMHLYDAWGTMKKDQLNKKESYVKNLEELDIKTAKNNLAEYNEYIVYHEGYIPESLHVKPDSPDLVSYLHIDLNAAKPTIDALDFFYPRLLKGGVILFDDYGSETYDETMIAINQFFRNKPGTIFKFPTGQAAYFHH